ncbi:DUF493 family protein [Pseudodesulfovibrio sp.]|uniref:DUF493 family protein n=1 Tax=unclassified Pseudodesulfovibrio TaxID=2661612 RepID=UPI003B00C674
MDDRHKQFHKLLNDHHEWPCPYLFKFIVPFEKLDEFCSLFQDYDLRTRPSRTGKYVSVTFETNMCSSHEVMEVYSTAAQVSGVMSL